MAGEHNRRVAALTFYGIMLVVMIIDLVLYPIFWTTLFYYMVTHACMVFRIFGRNIFSIFLHFALLTTSALLMYFQPPVNFIKADEIEITSQKRQDYIFTMLMYPSTFWMGISTIVFFSIITRPRSVRKIFCGIHSVIGLYVCLIYFLICVFYVHYFKKHNLCVIVEMFYWLAFLIMMLVPEFMDKTQMLSKCYVEEIEEIEEEQEVTEMKSMDRKRRSS